MQAILFAATTNPASSREFYEGQLGLRFVEDSPFALVFDAQGTMLRVQKVEQVVAAPYTSLGFEVNNIEDKMREVIAKGLQFETYEFLEQDGLGIWTTPDGAKIAWCKDPDGNVISFSQLPATN